MSDQQQEDTPPDSPKSLFNRDQASFLLPGEEPIAVGRVHGAIFWKAAAVLLLAAALLFTAAANLSTFLGGIGIFMYIYAYITKRYLLLMLTNKHVIIRSGIAFADVTQIRLSKVESVNLFAGLLGQIFGYAAVELRGTGQRAIMVPYIANSSQFRRKLEEALLEREERQ